MENQSQTSIRKCPHCQKEIDVQAKKCPCCQSDLRGWSSKHPILTVFLVLIGLSIIFSIIGAASNNNSNTNLGQEPIQTKQALSLTGQNNPTIKQISTVPADYIGQSFDLTVNAKAANYYNYSFNDDTKYYSIQIWDDSVQYPDINGVYAYLVKNATNKALFDNLINGQAVIKIHASIPANKWEQGSNAFLQIDSWQQVQ